MNLDTTNVELSGRIQVLESGDLLISHVKETDSGKYTCLGSNEAGTVSESAFLRVMGMFNIILFIFIICLIYSDIITYTSLCHVRFICSENVFFQYALKLFNHRPMQLYY